MGNTDTQLPPQYLDQARTEALLKALQALSDQYGLGMDTAALASAEQPCPQDAGFYLHTLFPARTVSHTEELGEAPASAYPRLLEAYAEATAGEFAPESIEADSEDDWDSLLLLFRHGGKKQRFKVSDVEDSDWFTATFVQALNRYAKRQGLSGRWVDFHNGDDNCTAIYVPEAAHARFKSLKTKYSAAAASEVDCLPAPEADNQPNPMMAPPALEVTLDKAQLVERKAAWPELEARLLQIHDKSEVKRLQRYHLTGKESPWDTKWEEEPIPLVYRLWLHPDQSDASWCAITERVLSYAYPGATQRSVYESRQRLRPQPSWVERDIFGEARERLTLFLQGHHPPGDRYRFEGERLYYYRRFYGEEGARLCEELDNTRPDENWNDDGSNAEYWREYLHGTYSARFMRRGPEYAPRTYFRVHLHQIASYSAPVAGGPDHARQLYCQRRRDALDSGPLIAPLDAWWADAKARATQAAAPSRIGELLEHVRQTMKNE